MLGRDPVTFGVVWRGYNRRQVNEFLDMELRWLTADRDAAIAMVCKLTTLLNESRLEARRLRERFDDQCRSSLPARAASDRARRLVEIAHADASGIVARARARAEHIQSAAAEAALRLGTRAERRRQRIEQAGAGTQCHIAFLLGRQCDIASPAITPDPGRRPG